MVTSRMAHAGSCSPSRPTDLLTVSSQGELSCEGGDGQRGAEELLQFAGTLGSPPVLYPTDRDLSQSSLKEVGNRPDSPSVMEPLLPLTQHSAEKDQNRFFDMLPEPHCVPLWPEGDLHSQERGSSSAAQVLFQASILQAQRCILDLQGAIDQQAEAPKICPLIPDRPPEAPPDQEPPVLVLDSGSSGTQDEEGESLEEDGEEEEYLFYNNPLFRGVSDSTGTMSSEGLTLWDHPRERSMEDEGGILEDSWVSSEPDDDDDSDTALCLSVNPVPSPSPLATEHNLCGSLSSSPVPSYVPHYRSLSPLMITEGDNESTCSWTESTGVPDQLVPNSSESTWDHVPAGANHAVDLPAQGLLFSASNSFLASALLQEPPESCPPPAAISWASSSSPVPAAPAAVHCLWQEDPGPQASLHCHPSPSCAWVGESQATSCLQKEVAAPDSHPVSLGVDRKLESSSAEGLEMVEVPTVRGDETLEEEVEKMDPSPHCLKDRYEDLEAEDSVGQGGSVHANGTMEDWAAALRLATRLYRLDGFQRSQVATFLRKNNDFSWMVTKAYLSFFDFGRQTLDQALRSFLKAFVLTGETQERERILRHFSQRYHSCNPGAFLSPDAVHTLTCAVMLLNTDLHGKNIGRSMSCQEFVANLDGLNEGKNFPKELLKGMYSSIRHEKLEWAGGEEELPDNPSLPLAAPSQKNNPFLMLTHDPDAKVYQQGLLARKVHAEADGKKTPWGKRGWKTFHAVLKGTVLYFFKEDGSGDACGSEESIGVHHALAEKASRYTKRPHVFRLQTADWCIFLFQARTAEEMDSWISRINLVAAMFSSPPFPAAVGSQRKFVRPIFPTAPCKNSLEDQHLAHEGWMDKVTSELLEHQRSLPSKRGRGRDLEDYQLKKEFLLHEKRRYETYVRLLEVKLNSATEDLDEWEARLRDVEESCPALHKSHSSPSLNVEGVPATTKVKRNISERRTVRKIIPRRNKHLL